MPFFLWARKGRRVWPWILVLTICLRLLFLLSRNLDTAAHLVAVFTDFYDTESTAFLLLFAMLTCGGMLFGVLLAAAVAWVLRKIDY